MTAGSKAEKTESSSVSDGARDGGVRDRGVRARRVLIRGDPHVLLSVPLQHDPRIAQLTDAELHVVRALLTGASNALVASVRNTSVRTVANQVRRIFAKLGVSSRAELALELGDVALTRREVER